VRDEVGLDFDAVAEAQRRVGRHHFAVGRKHRRRAKGHERAADIRHLVPALHRSDAVDLRDAVRLLAVPPEPRPIRRIAGLEDESTAGAQRRVDGAERRLPVRALDDRLRDVRGHGRKVDL
jgi:hypothetical protein